MEKSQLKVKGLMGSLLQFRGFKKKKSLSTCGGVRIEQRERESRRQIGEAERGERRQAANRSAREKEATLDRRGRKMGRPGESFFLGQKHGGSQKTDR